MITKDQASELTTYWNLYTYFLTKGYTEEESELESAYLELQPNVRRELVNA